VHVETVASPRVVGADEPASNTETGAPTKLRTSANDSTPHASRGAALAAPVVAQIKTIMTDDIFIRYLSGNDEHMAVGSQFALQFAR
jgi:hypothetical protein